MKKYKNVKQLKKKLSCLRSPDPATRVDCYRQFCRENDMKEIGREIRQLEADNTIAYEAVYTRLMADYIVHLSNSTFRDISNGMSKESQGKI